jgi:hypothetical protein
MILPIAQGYRTGTLTVLQEPETDVIPIDLNPDVATCMAGPPFEKYDALVLFELPSPFEQVLING